MDSYESWLEAEIKMAAKDKETVDVLLDRVERILGKYLDDKGDGAIGDSGVPTSIKMALNHVGDVRSWLELVPIDKDSVKLSNEVMRHFKEESK